VLAEIDLAALTCRYQASGRKAFHPRTLLGLIVYGILNRQWSLRELEGLARRDVGAWWLCGGHQPDHSTIGKFIVLHAEILTEQFFVDLVKHLVTRLKLGPTLTAGDSTLLDAAASRFRLLWSEAAEQAAQEAREIAAAAPDDAKLRRKAELANAAVQLGAERLARRRVHSGNAAEVKVSLIEPEAVHQRAKDKTRRPTSPSCWPTPTASSWANASNRATRWRRSRQYSINIRRSLVARRRPCCSTAVSPAMPCGSHWSVKVSMSCARPDAPIPMVIGKSCRRGPASSASVSFATMPPAMCTIAPPAVN
jgi:transposase